MKTVTKTIYKKKNDFYKTCQNIDGKKLLLAFRKAQLIVAQDAVKKS